MGPLSREQLHEHAPAKGTTMMRADSNNATEEDGTTSRLSSGVKEPNGRKRKNNRGMAYSPAERRRSFSPALSRVTAVTDEFIRNLESTLMK